jgi:hypothetical protein
MIIIPGTTTNGLGIATTRTVKAQMPHFLKEFPEIAGCRIGTINVELDHPLDIREVDHATGPIEWEPDFTEKFSFLRVRFECPVGAEPVDAWLYIAHRSPHFTKANYVEVLTEDLGEIERGTSCCLHVLNGTVQVGNADRHRGQLHGGLGL